MAVAPGITGYRISIDIKSQGDTTIAPDPCHINAAGGDLKWTIQCTWLDVDKVRIEFQDPNIVAFPSGNERTLVPDNGTKRAEIDAVVNQNTTNVQVDAKYDVVHIDDKGKEIDRIDPYIIVDKP